MVDSMNIGKHQSPVYNRPGICILDKEQAILRVRVLPRGRVILSLVAYRLFRRENVIKFSVNKTNIVQSFIAHR